MSKLSYPVYTIDDGILKIEVFNNKEEMLRFLGKSENRGWCRIGGIEVGVYLEDTYRLITVNI